MPFIYPDSIETLLGLLKEIDEGYAYKINIQAETLKVTAPYLSSSQVQQLISELLKRIRPNDYWIGRVGVNVRLTRRLSQERKHALTRRLIAEIQEKQYRSIDSYKEDFIELIDTLHPLETQEVLGSLLVQIPQLDTSEQRILDHLYPILPDSLVLKALDTCYEIGRSLNTIVPYLAPLDREPVVKRVLEDVKHGKPMDILPIAQYVPETMIKVALEEANNKFQHQPKAYLRQAARAFSNIPNKDKKDWFDLIVRCIQITEGSELGYSFADIFRDLAPSLETQQFDQMLDFVVDKLSDSREIGQSIEWVAEYLPIELHEKTLEIVMKIPDEGWKFNTLIALLPHLNQDTIRMTIQMLSSIQDKIWFAFYIAAVALHSRDLVTNAQLYQAFEIAYDIPEPYPRAVVLSRLLVNIPEQEATILRIARELALEQEYQKINKEDRHEGLLFQIGGFAELEYVFEPIITHQCFEMMAESIKQIPNEWEWL